MEIHYAFLQHSCLHTGGAGEKTAAFAFNCVHVVIATPTSSKPELQVYVAVSPTEEPVNVTMPFEMLGGTGHSAAEQVRLIIAG